MTSSTTTTQPPWRTRWSALTLQLERLCSHHLIALAARLGIAAVFW